MNALARLDRTYARADQVAAMLQGQPPERQRELIIGARGAPKLLTDTEAVVLLAVLGLRLPQRA